MREILFRGKSAFGGGWVYGDLSHFHNNLFIRREAREEDVSVPVIRVEPETLGQFTGLTDKNGVKIFEGDIVKARMTDKYTVVFNRGAFMGEYTSAIAGFTVRVDLLKDDWEVIGNIHDNPELLEEVK